MKAALKVGIILASAVMVLGTVSLGAPGTDQEAAFKSTVSAFAGEPIAVIKDLPPQVSNGTPTALDGSGSYDPDGTIVSYDWRIIVGGSITDLTGISVTYIFSLIADYEIELTVTDNESKTDKDFEAVSAVSDLDDDDLPDWWEQRYFGNLVQIPSGDYDSDGYLNSEEYADGTNPTVKDEGPSFLSTVPIWVYIAIVAAVVAVVFFIFFWPKMRKMQKEKEQKKIQYALEIEKALEDEK